MDEVNRAKISQATELLLEVLEATKTAPAPQSATPPAPSAERRKIAWGKTKSDDFCKGVLWIESKIGLDADKLMACMRFESNINPKARNPASSATGLIQFMDKTVADMQARYPQLVKLFPGVKKASDLTALTDVQQLTWVYYYFLAFGTDLSNWSVEDVYMAILLPNMIGKPLDSKMNWSADAYRVNKGLDLNRDGNVTKREAAAKVRQLYDLGRTEEFMG